MGGAPGGIRTHGLQSRSLTLYPAELRAHTLNALGRISQIAGIVKVGSFDPESPLYDEFNTGRMLYASRILPFIDKEEGLNTTKTNPYYAE